MLYLEDYLESECVRRGGGTAARCGGEGGAAAPLPPAAADPLPPCARSDRAASHGSARQVHRDARDGPAGAEYVSPAPPRPALPSPLLPARGGRAQLQPPPHARPRALPRGEAVPPLLLPGPRAKRGGALEPRVQAVPGGGAAALPLLLAAAGCPRGGSSARLRFPGAAESC